MFIQIIIYIFIILFIIIIKSKRSSLSYTSSNHIFASSTNIISSLNKLFEAQKFSNITKDNSIRDITIYTANARGENHLFAIKNNSFQFTSNDIDFIYQISQSKHIHNVILLPIYVDFSVDLLNKIESYDIQIWDYEKLNSLIASNSISILPTSNTSGDTCKIDKNQYNPIQEPESFISKFFKKPNQL